jgi:hypothetical protein
MNAQKLIPAAQHPSNTDPTAELVSGPRDLFSVFKVKGGFLAITFEGLAFEPLFQTKASALDAITRLELRSAAAEKAGLA